MTNKAMLAEKDKEIAKYQQWVNDLQSSMYINCVYCGHRYGPKKNTPVAMADVLKQHIEKCPKHPLSAALQEIAALKEEGQEAACINNHNVEVLSQEIAKLKADNENMAKLNDSFPEEIARLEDEIATLKEKIKEQDEEVYCPTCGACGEEGCCPPDRCEHLKCFYGEHYAKTYRDLEAENQTLRSLVDGVTEVVEIWELNGSPAQKEWKADWLAKAREALK